MSSDAGRRLAALLAPVVAECGLYLEDVTLSAAGRRRLVRVTVDLPDGPGGVGSDSLAEASHAVSAALDEADAIDGSYLLEVSTPGVGRPLREARHYRRAVGRLVSVRARSGESWRGRLVAADAATITLSLDGVERHVRYADVAAGAVEVELKTVEEVAD